MRNPQFYISGKKASDWLSEGYKSTFARNNVNFSSNVFCGIYLPALWQNAHMNLICNICSKTTVLRPHLLGFTLMWCHTNGDIRTRFCCFFVVTISLIIHGTPFNNVVKLHVRWRHGQAITQIILYGMYSSKPNWNVGFTKPPLKLGHGLVITSHYFKGM